MMEGYAPSLEGYYYCHCGLLLPKMPRNPDRGADFVADGTSDRNADGTSYRNADGNADGNAKKYPPNRKANATRTNGTAVKYPHDRKANSDRNAN